MLARFACWGILLLLLGSDDSFAQRLVPEEVSCPRCTIDARSVLRIGTLDSPLPSEAPAEVVADGRGRYWIFEWNTPPLVFDSRGNLLHEFKRGQGPNEFGYASGAVLLPGDSVAILDPDNRRLAIFSPDFSSTRSLPLTTGISRLRILRWPDQVIGNRSTTGPEQPSAPPIHLLTLAGNQLETVRTFGTARTGLTGFAAATSGLRGLSSVRNGLIWEAEHTRYNLYQWGVDGTLRDSLQRRPAWFSVESGLGIRRSAPEPRVQAVDWDAQGLVWVFLSQPTGISFAAAMPKRPAGASEVRTDQIAFEKLYRTVIEVIDPNAGRVVARTTIQSLLSTVLPDGRAVFYNVTAEGVPYLEFMTLRLVGNGR
jgi:hypothetical protein